MKKIIAFAILCGLLAVCLISQAGPDLVVTSITNGTTTDAQTLLISGNLSAQVRNLGGSTPIGFLVYAFEDRNLNSQYDAGVDVLLGQTSVAGGLGAGSNANVVIPISGSVLFRGNVIYVYADALNGVPESSETNNYRHSGQNSVFTPPAVTALNPTLKWIRNSFTERPESRNVLSPPAVGDVNGDGIPDVVFSTFDLVVPIDETRNGVLRAVSGDTGNVLFSVTDPTLEVHPGAPITLADLDNDGRPEIVTMDEGCHPIAFEHDGTLKWRSTEYFLYFNCWDGASAVDLDHNGTVELVIGNRAFAGATGALLWTGTGTSGAWFGGFLSVVADLDLDGTPEVIAGPTAYRADGSIYWNSLGKGSPPLGDGLAAVANMDDDPYPEVFLVEGFYIYLLEHDGTIKWIAPNNFDYEGGPPVIADFDNDGKPDIGVPDHFGYTCYNSADGSIKWRRQIFDASSGVTGSSVFDFNNDGSSEVVFADEVNFYIVRGSDGSILNQFPRSSLTAFEGPIVADVDGDGHADIIVPATIFPRPMDPGTDQGIRVYSGANNNWANTRKVWNQEQYSITNINDDLSVPRYALPNWLVPGLNNFRAQALPPGFTQANSAPDLVTSYLRKNDSSFPGQVELIARVGNGGSGPAIVNRVEFRSGAGGPLLGFANTSRTLNPGEFEDVHVFWANPPAGQVNLVVTADSANVLNEGDETNNTAATQLLIGVGPSTTVDDLIARAKDAGVDLKWTPIANAVSYNVYRRSGASPAAAIRTGLVTAAGAYTDQPLTNDTTYYYNVRFVTQAGVESAIGAEVSGTPSPRTRRGDTPPTLTSIPVTRGRTLTPYVYTPAASDPDPGEILTWSLAGAPAGMVINSSSGRIDWTPSLSQGGPYRLTLTVTDTKTRVAVQTFTLFIETQTVNSAPRFLSTALTSGNVGRLYSYGLRATDPDAGDVLTYLLDTAPSGMTVNASTGLLQWTPASLGTFPVQVRARDLSGAAVTQSFSITVTNSNRGPVITSTPGTTGTVNQTYSYPATATDADAGDTKTWSLRTAPAGMTVNAATGLVLWTPNSGQLGAFPVVLEVRDTIGALALQSFTLTISTGGSNNAPPVFTSTPSTHAVVGQLYSYDANAVDPEGTAITFLLFTAPGGMTINASSGLVSWTPTLAQAGPQNVSVQARDASGTISSQNFTVTVEAVFLDPVFQLISPTAGSDLTKPVNMTANISDPNPSGPTINWSVKLLKAGTADRTLASGNGPVSGGTIATFDPTMLANDAYTLRVEVFKGPTQGIQRDIPYSASGELKLGEFTTSALDLSIPIAGVPINISRVYNSLDTRTGDFGAGWTLGLFGSVVDAPSESPLEAMRAGSKVYVTRPDGRRVGFRFDPFAPAILFPYVVTPRFTADSGVTDKLEVADASVFLFDGVAYADFTNFWNPRRYILTTQEGVRYEIDEQEGIKLIRDRNGNTITFTPTAIVSSTGVQLTLTRDGSNRITRIVEPGGADLRYIYDAAGNLTQVINEMGQITRYFYTNVSFPNYLTRIEDPLGRPVTRTVFDATGRMSAVCDANGNITTLAGCQTLTYDPNGQTQTSFNARGFRLDSAYDARGNLISERSYLDATTFRETLRTYDAADNLLTQRDPAGNLTRFSYDNARHVLTRTDSGGHTTTYTYDAACSKVATETDPMGGVATKTYDANCRLRFDRDRAGQTTEYRYDAAGNQTHFIDPQGATWVRSFTPEGYLATIQDPRGRTIVQGRSLTGELTSQTERDGRRIDYTYDAAHRVIRETWADGRVIQYTRDAAGQITNVTDPSATLAYQFTPLGDISQTDATYPSQPVFTIQYSYDANRNRTSIVDSLGGQITRSFTALDQLSSITQSGGGINNKRIDYTYDLSGLPTAMRRFSDLAGVAGVANTAFDYDCGGCGTRLTGLRNTTAAGAPLPSVVLLRNALDTVTQMTDPEGVHLYQYDLAQRLTQVTHPNVAIQPAEQYSYDAAGNRLSSHLTATSVYAYQAGSAGNAEVSDDQYDYEYDNTGSLTRRRQHTDSSTVNYEYDFRGRVTAIIGRTSGGVETARVTFAYDAFNRRISMTESTGETRFYYDGRGAMLVLAPGGTTRRLFAPGIDRVVTEESSGQTRWMLTDHVGTLRSMIDSNGVVLNHFRLDSFGRALSSTVPAGPDSQLSFTGREKVPVSGDLYFRARLYSARQGRFLQEDARIPYAYAYASNSPLTRTDPLGRGDESVSYAKLAITAVKSACAVAFLAVGITAGAAGDFGTATDALEGVNALVGVSGAKEELVAETCEVAG